MSGRATVVPSGEGQRKEGIVQPLRLGLREEVGGTCREDSKLKQGPWPARVTWEPRAQDSHEVLELALCSDLELPPFGRPQCQSALALVAFPWTTLARKLALRALAPLLVDSTRVD